MCFDLFMVEIAQFGSKCNLVLLYCTEISLLAIIDYKRWRQVWQCVFWPAQASKMVFQIKELIKINIRIT